MPLEDASVIDFIQKSPANRLALVITDSGTTTDPGERLGLFCAKIDTYTTYVASEQFKKDYPEISPSNANILVVCANPPSEEMKDMRGVKLPDDSGIVLAIDFQEFRPG